MKNFTDYETTIIARALRERQLQLRAQKFNLVFAGPHNDETAAEIEAARDEKRAISKILPRIES